MRKMAFAVLFLPLTVLAADTYDLDPTHTYPNFSINHLDFSLMQGRFNETSGRLVLDRNGGESALDVTVKIDSLDTGMRKRDDVLLSPDFFDAGKYPEMHYVSTRVIFTGEKSARVEGSLSLHGVTRPLTLGVTRINCGAHPLKRTWTCGFDASATLKRSDYGITAYLPKIGDEISIRIAAEAERREKSTGPRR